MGMHIDTMKARILLIVFGAVAAAALGVLVFQATDNRQGTGKAPPPTSGIEGQVFVGPQCPVVRQGALCPDRPLEATIVVWDVDRTREVTTFTTDEQGRFRISLAPGDYYLDPQRPEADNPFPAPSPQTIAVRPNAWTRLTVRYDSGIRGSETTGHPGPADAPSRGDSGVGGGPAEAPHAPPPMVGPNLDVLFEGVLPANIDRLRRLSPLAEPAPALGC